MKARHHLIALAAMAALTPALAQTSAPAAAAEPAAQRIEVTGSLIKRTDRETPSAVQSYTRQEIQRSGYANSEDLLRSLGAVDTGSIGDAAASGFVGGLSTISLRGFGSQATLMLINGRRTAPVAAVDINFGRGSLISVNTIPKGAIDRIDVLKDGASAMYGSDAMAGVINYVLRKEYQGAEASVEYSANDKGKGVTKQADLTFGFGNIDTQRFNVFGGLQISKRDPVNFSELKDRGNQAGYDAFLTSTDSLARFTPRLHRLVLRQLLPRAGQPDGQQHHHRPRLHGGQQQPVGRQLPGHAGGLPAREHRGPGRAQRGRRRFHRQHGQAARRASAASTWTTPTRPSPSKTASTPRCAAPSPSATA